MLEKLSNNTLQSYERDILQYQEYAEENRMNYAKVDQSDLKRYLDHLSEIGKKPSKTNLSSHIPLQMYQYKKRLLR